MVRSSGQIVHQGQNCKWISLLILSCHGSQAQLTPDVWIGEAQVRAHLLLVRVEVDRTLEAVQVCHAVGLCRQRACASLGVPVE